MKQPSDHQTTTWNKSYELDIPAIDKQHMKFFRLFDKLMLLSKDGANYNELGEVIEELEQYTHVHFKTEEALMRKAQSPGYDFHLSQHTVFVKKVEEFKTAFAYRNSELLGEMIIFMRKWFLLHIQEIDSQYVSSVKEYVADKGWPYAELNTGRTQQ